MGKAEIGVGAQRGGQIVAQAESRIQIAADCAVEGRGRRDGRSCK
jgi:hypothetical protein